MVYRKIQAYRKAANPAMQTASKALLLASKTAKLLNVEKKFHDVAETAAVGESASPSIKILNAIPQGDTGESRDGDQAKLTDILIRADLQSHQSASTPTRWRAMLFLDKQHDGTAPTVAELLQDASNDAYAQLSGLNMDNKMRFRILKTWDGILEVPGVGSRQIKRIEFYHKFSDPKRKNDNGIRVRYSGTGSTISDISSNPIYFYMFQTQSTNQPTLVFYSRVRYVDN